MRTLYYDCFAGISGDMNLGAMIDLGIDPLFLKSELCKLKIDGFDLKITKDQRRGINCTKATVLVLNPENEKHRHLRHIEEIIFRSDLSLKIKNLALNIFKRIAKAEAKIHGVTMEQVHFHEVGALDSIIDIVGAAICLEALKVQKVICSPVQLGDGMVKCAHGIMPVPAPATSLILEDIPVKTGLVQHEATTPTGAAILAEIVDEFSDKVNFTIKKTGFGIGQRDVSEVPNVLRVYLVENDKENAQVSPQVLLECNIDDMNPEHYDFVLDYLFRSGASDAWLTPIIMKKNRPATTLSVLVDQNKSDLVKKIIFENTTTIGVREQVVLKSFLKRSEKSVHTNFGQVRIKESYLEDKVIRVKPEYEDCKRLALLHQTNIETIEKEVFNKLNNDNERNSGKI